MGVNSAGLFSKLNSLDSVLKEVQPTVFFIQESKFKQQGKIKTENARNYQIFELLRKESNGGGLTIGALHDVESVWLSEGDDTVEVLVIQVRFGELVVRCVGAYGPQETNSVDRKQKFWERLSKEVIDADENDDAFILQMDGNLWAGTEIIKRDPHSCNQNGKHFKEFLIKHPHLVVVNNVDLCEGLITRRRKLPKGWKS